jgi:hypothetical protein
LTEARHRAEQALELYATLDPVEYRVDLAESFANLARIETAAHRPGAACAAYRQAQKRLAAGEFRKVKSNLDLAAEVEREVAACDKR